MSQAPENLHEPIADLPNPELNPLLNPLLGRHLGQWAHVYFTTAPEKREEALFELLEDLKAQEARDGTAPAAQATAADAIADGAYAIVCPRCERSNVRSQKYCGMCGALMPVRAQAAAASSGSTTVGNGMFEEAHSAILNDRVDAPLEHEFDEYNRPPRITEAHSPFAATSLLFQAGSDEVSDDPAFARREESETRSAPVDIDWLRNRNFSADADDGNSRIVSYLLGLAVVICIGILVFLLAIRPNMHDKSAAGQKPPVNWNITQNAPTQMPTVQNREAAPSNPIDSNAATQPPNASGPSGASAAREAENAGSAATRVAAPALNVRASRKTKPAEDAVPSASDADQSGALEVSMARQYLSGTNGHPDGAAAVNVLWKAVAKGNTSALLILSDIFATGIGGVPKNCEQARPLIDAALRKNVPTADIKLRELQKTCP